MYFPDDIWGEITSFLIHNIKKHGKHLVDHKYNKTYNKIMYSIPSPCIPRTGPRIVYSSVKNKYRFVKFVYYCKFLNKRFHGSIIEMQLLPIDYDQDNKKMDSLYRAQYFSQFFKINKNVQQLLTTT